VPGGLKNERHGRGVDPIEIFGIGHAVDIGAADVFGTAAIDHVAEVGEVAATVVVAGETSGTLAAGHAGSKDNFLANMKGVNLGANFGDLAGDVAAGNVWKGNGNTRQAAPDPEVEVVESTGVDANQDFVGAQMRLIHIGVAKNARITMLVEDDGFHERPPGTITKWNATPGRYIVSRYVGGT
jgi:hypothetical protein